MIDHVVIGCLFGDEGKGRVVDWLCSILMPSLVVRFSGGHQAGHRVSLDKKTDHVCSNFGSGSLRGVPTYWSSFCTVDPVAILVEGKLLQEKGFSPILYIDSKCPVTTPYDKLYNRYDSKTQSHGTCGVGFGATIQREEDMYSLLFEDLFNDTALRIKLEMIQDYYAGSFLKDKARALKAEKEFLSACIELKKYNVVELVDGMPLDSWTSITSPMIFEGSQGLLLDQNIGFFPHVTRSNTGTNNVLPMTKGNPHIWLVTRAYQTRHGNGPMTNENIPFVIDKNPNEQNVDDGAQGKFRTSILDLDLLEYAINKDSAIKQTTEKSLVITCLDHLRDGYKFTRHEKTFSYSDRRDFIDQIRTILNIEDIYISEKEYGDIVKYE